MERINNLVAQFNGAIKYTPMLKDHPEWSDEECLEFAYKWHPVAIHQLKEALNRDYIDGHWHNPPAGISTWNDGIPYCRNLPSASMIREALS